MMTIQKIIIGSDHAGFALKQKLVHYLQETGLAVLDMGPNDSESVDYPDFAQQVCQEVLKDSTTVGVLICGTGIGMAIAANKIRGIRAALCHNVTTARLAREHNNANILAIGARTMGDLIAEEIIDVFVETPFDGGRHQRRLDKIHGAS